MLTRSRRLPLRRWGRLGAHLFFARYGLLQCRRCTCAGHFWMAPNTIADVNAWRATTRTCKRLHSIGIVRLHRGTCTAVHAHVINK